VFTGPFIQRLGCHVEAVGPSHGSDLRVDVRLGEEGGIGEWLRHASPVPSGEVDVAYKSVLERDAQLRLRHRGLYRALVKVSDGAHVSDYSTPILVR
jgi:hypothetical protein